MRHREGTARRGLVAATVGLLLVAAPAAGRSAEPAVELTAVVVALPAVEVAPLLEEAKRAGGAQWRGHVLRRPKRDTAGPLARALDNARQAYVEADFLRCLAACRRAAGLLDEALERGERALVARTHLVTAACATGAGDRDLARSWLTRLFVQGHEIDDKLLRTTPDVQELAEEVRAGLLARPRIAVRVATKPSGAWLRLDGAPVPTCQRTPCQLKLMPGEHVLALERLGVGRRLIRRTFARDDRVEVSLDTLDADAAKAQLERALDDGQIGGDGFATAAAVAYGAQVVALVWRSERGAHAQVFDRQRRRTVSRVTVVGGEDPPARALRSALQEWGGSRAPPFYSRPIFYVPVAVAAAVATGIVIYLVARPDTPSHEFVFP